jgi:hypothetical protein
MLELLALPRWDTPAKSLDDWVVRLTELGANVVVERESAGVSWIEIGAMRLRGYAVSEGERLEAINFELSDPDPENANRLLEAVATDLGWELHPDDPDDDDVD